MAKLVFGMNMSLDGYVDHDHPDFKPSVELFQHFIEQVRSQPGSIYGRRMYEIMRYWDEDRAEWGPAERDYAAGWRGQHKWVVSKTLQSVGPNATLISGDLELAIRELKEKQTGELEVAGPVLAGSLTKLGLIDEYQIYLRPVVIGHGRPFFTEARPPLRLIGSERIGESVIRLTYVPE